MLKQRSRLIKLIIILSIALILLGIIAITVTFSVRNANYSFTRSVSEAEQELRLQVVSTAESWLGAEEGSAAHAEILSIYNAHEPLAQGYEVQPEDNWCATFVSVVAIQCGLTDIIPTECGCQRQIALWQELDCWQEDDAYVPLPGDIIYYCGSDHGIGGDCTGWSDHVGIVVGTWNGRLKVIEGNNQNTVRYRYLAIDATGIRGYATPDYESKTVP